MSPFVTFSPQVRQLQIASRRFVHAECIGGHVTPKCSVLVVTLSLRFTAAAQQADWVPIEVQLEQPYVALQEAARLAANSRAQLRPVRSAIERERDEKINQCRDARKHSQRAQSTARKELKEINGSASRDTDSMAARRETLHVQIADLEHAIRNSAIECDHLIPAAFEVKLAKLHLIEHWPKRRDEIARRIEDGRARKRKHGDIDDIGYRRIVKQPEEDIAVGQQAAQQMTSSGLMPSPLQDLDIQHYVRELAGKIAESSDLKVPLHVTVIDSPNIAPITLPGGFLYIPFGLIRAAETEAQLAGVMSREIARIASRHGTRASKRSFMSKLFVPAAQVTTGLFTGGFSNAGTYYGVNYGLQGLGTLVDRALVEPVEKYQKEADQLGVQYAWKAGFDPYGFIAFLDSLAKDQSVSRVPTVFRPEEKLGERLLNEFTEIEYLPHKESYRSDSVEFQKIKEALQ